MTWGGHVLLAYCRTQDTIALSTGEAELKSSVKGTTEALGVQELVHFLRRHPCDLEHSRASDQPLEHSTDSAASFGIVKRKGAGALKHLSVKELWIQEVYRRPGNTILKVPRSVNVADVMCSSGNVADQQRHLLTLNMTLERRHTNPRGGDHSSASGTPAGIPI